MTIERRIAGTDAADGRAGTPAPPLAPSRSGTGPGEPRGPDDAAGSRARAVPPVRLHWWREALVALAFYGVYSGIRNLFGSASVSPGRALDNARHVIRIERAVGLFHEESVQDLFLHWRPFIRFWNIFYGSLHFVVTIAVLIVLFRRFPERYRRWRNTLACTTGLALVGFSTFPLMPPRLLGECATAYGACLPHYGFVDTLARIGGLWSFDSGTMQSISNQYAAMPSLHFAWSSWCALALVPVLRNRAAKVALMIYPWATLFAIVVTANHYWLDAAGGAVVLGVGWVLGGLLLRVADRFHARRHLRFDHQRPAHADGPAPDGPTPGPGGPAVPSSV